MIRSNAEIKFENVLSFRGKMTSNGINAELAELRKFITENNIKKNGPLISVTFSYEEPLVDIEYLIPVENKKIENSKYTIKPIFHIVNAICARHVGDISGLQGVYEELNNHIHTHALQPITPAYNINVNDEQMAQGEKPLIDIYIGINPNKL